MTIGTATSWYTDQMRIAKLIIRNAERRLMKDGNIEQYKASMAEAAEMAELARESLKGHESPRK